ncbi:MAG: hypothetical protein U5R06_10995 [candidate division KSB1 bacterium]|nr:hypothetical protein [candidate division KSB1 bacterium]
MTCVLVLGLAVLRLAAAPLALHPENPHYFIYNGEPTVLITSAEHYGAVLNADFDYDLYLNTLHNDGMNYTRLFTGSYVEIPGSFGIGNNTLAPDTGRFLAPWKRVAEPGLYAGEKKFDLSQWNPDYFRRLRAFVARAQELGILVEVTLFCSTYQDAYWERNPFNPGNNINDIPPDLQRKKSNTLKNGALTGFQKQLVQKIVTELNEFDNVFYEIQNEPWADDPVRVMRTLRSLDPRPGEGDWFKWAERASDAILEWQNVMARTIVETEKSLPQQHLIAQNYTNFKHSIAHVDEQISIINFHYAWPQAVWMNMAWERPIGFDESGFAGSSDTTYLRQAWQFMLAGGALFNNLDYSFFVGAEAGSGDNDAPGGGSPRLRRQLAVLRKFIHSFDFIRMQPDHEAVVHAPGLQWQGISEPGKQYAVIFTGVGNDWIKLDLSEGEYHYDFVSPFTGKVLKSGIEKFASRTRLMLPEFAHMVALRIKK